MRLTKRKMYKKMREILRYVENGGDPEIKDAADSDIWGECVTRGFLNAHPDSDRDESGIWHIFLLNHNITPTGIEWLYAPNVTIKSTISIAVSIAALLVSILANLDKIISSCASFAELLASLK